MRSGGDLSPRLLIATNVPSTLSAFLLPYAAHYRARGWRVDAATHGGQQDPVLTAAFDQVHEIPWTRRPSDPANLTTAVRAVRSLVLGQGYDLVHVHDPVASFVTRYALRRLRRALGFSVIYTAHGFHFYRGGSWPRNLLFRGVEGIASRWTDFLVVINREDEAAAQRFGLGRRERVVYMPGIGVDMSKYGPAGTTESDARSLRTELGLHDGQVLLAMVAELNPGKRHLDALDALARSGREQVVLACAGVGPMEEAIRQRAEALGLTDRLRLLGYRQDVPILLRASAALILPSEREGLPRCIMEAACMERPVIATRIRGVTELVRPDTGFLSEVGDVDGLSRSIQYLVDEPKAAEAMGRRGREAMRDFDLTNVLALHDTLYQRALATQ